MHSAICVVKISTAIAGGESALLCGPRPNNNTDMLFLSIFQPLFLSRRSQLTHGFLFRFYPATGTPDSWHTCLHLITTAGVPLHGGQAHGCVLGQHTAAL